jgi:hypothetical protein
MARAFSPSLLCLYTTDCMSSRNHMKGFWYPCSPQLRVPVTDPRTTLAGTGRGASRRTGGQWPVKPLQKNYLAQLVSILHTHALVPCCVLQQRVIWKQDCRCSGSHGNKTTANYRASYKSLLSVLSLLHLINTTQFLASIIVDFVLSN